MKTTKNITESEFKALIVEVANYHTENNNGFETAELCDLATAKLRSIENQLLKFGYNAFDVGNQAYNYKVGNAVVMGVFDDRYTTYEEQEKMKLF